jgi:hypothetical protein
MALRERPISRHLEAYEEGWKRDHDEAMHCRDFEEALAFGIAIFCALVQVDVARRHRVERGLEGPDPDEDEGMRESFRRWLRPCAQVLAALKTLEGKFGAVEGAADFRRCCEEAEEIVTEWRPARPAATEEVMAHTDRAMTTAELSAALDRVSRPVESDSHPLGFNPDDYPLF